MKVSETTQEGYYWDGDQIVEVARGADGRLRNYACGSDEWCAMRWNDPTEYVGPILPLEKMTNQQRLELVSKFCAHCGTMDLPCSCWNDE